MGWPGEYICAEGRSFEGGTGYQPEAGLGERGRLTGFLVPKPTESWGAPLPTAD